MSDEHADELMQYLRLRQRYGHRRMIALLDAAIDRHPGWQRNANRSVRQLDPSAPTGEALIDWLCGPHPELACSLRGWP